MEPADLVITGARIVTPAGTFDANVVVRDGRIASLEAPGRVGGRTLRVLDAGGLLALPGIIDPHVHSRDPGQTEKEDFAHSTMAAAAGGITTLLEMPNAIPPVVDAVSFADRVAHLGRSAFIDFGLWGMALPDGDDGRLEALHRAGAVAIKVFWGYAFDLRTQALLYDTAGRSETEVVPPISTGQLWDLFRSSARHRFVLGLHCEDRGIVDAASRAVGLVGDYEALRIARPAEAEAASVAFAIELSRTTGASIHVLHVSAGRTVELVRRAQADGIPVTAETCPHYLTLTDDDVERAPAAIRAFPPVRTAQDQEALWAGVNDGTICSIGSDHAPHTTAEREKPFHEQPAGVVGTETMVQVLLEAAHQGRTSIERLASVLSEGTAALYGLRSKGVLRPGADADITLIDPGATWQIDQDALHSKTHLSPWHGSTGRGRAVATVVRGRIVMRDAELVGSPTGREVLPG